MILARASTSKAQTGLVTDFVLWYRRLVPPDEQIIFCDDTYSFDTLVEPDTSRAEVLEILAG